MLEGVKVTAVERRGKTRVRLPIETEAGSDDIDGTHLLVAAGRAPNIAGLDLGKARVATQGPGDRRQRHAAHDQSPKSMPSAT